MATRKADEETKRVINSAPEVRENRKDIGYSSKKEERKKHRPQRTYQATGKMSGKKKTNKEVKRAILQPKTLNTVFVSQQEPDISYFTSSVERYYLKSLLNIPVAKLDASPPVDIALLAKVDAWLNRSQREKATVLVMVKASAIAKIISLSQTSWKLRKKGRDRYILTNQA
jgi:hypothetical protein